MGIGLESYCTYSDSVFLDRTGSVGGYSSLHSALAASDFLAHRAWVSGCPHFGALALNRRRKQPTLRAPICTPVYHGPVEYSLPGADLCRSRSRGYSDACELGAIPGVLCSTSDSDPRFSHSGDQSSFRAIFPRSRDFECFPLRADCVSTAKSQRNRGGNEISDSWGISSAFLLSGMALLYAASGRLDFSAARFEWAHELEQQSLGLLALMLIFSGIAFKLALVPFHMWSPDIYGRGAPDDGGVFIDSVKGGCFCRFLSNRKPFRGAHLLVSGLCLSGHCFDGGGNLLALRQDNIKRLLAYSSVGHLGYFVVALLAGAEQGLPAAIFYWISYFVALLSAFGVISLLYTSSAPPSASLAAIWQLR